MTICPLQLQSISSNMLHTNKLETKIGVRNSRLYNITHSIWLSLTHSTWAVLPQGFERYVTLGTITPDQGQLVANDSIIDQLYHS